MHVAKTSDKGDLEQLKAIVLKGKGSTMIVEIITSQHGEEAPNSCNHFETASPSVVLHPWIPQVPDSERIPDLDEKWEEDSYVLHARRTD